MLSPPTIKSNRAGSVSTPLLLHCLWLIAKFMMKLLGERGLYVFFLWQYGSVRLPEEALQERDRVERHSMMMSISFMYVKFLRCLEISHRTVLPSLFTKPLPLFLFLIACGCFEQSLNRMPMPIPTGRAQLRSAARESAARCIIRFRDPWALEGRSLLPSPLSPAAAAPSSLASLLESGGGREGER